MKNTNLVLFAYIGFLISGCAASTQYMRAEDTIHTYDLSYDKVIDSIPAAVKEAKMVLIEVRKDDGVVDVVAPPSFWTSSLGNLMQGGDKVTVVIKKVDELSTSVEITSQSRGDLIDLGRSARVVGTLFKNLDKVLGQTQTNKVSAAPKKIQPPPSSASAPQKLYALDQLLKDRRISQADYEQRKAAILGAK